MNQSLKNNSDSWKVNAKQRVLGKYRPALVSFGPVKTVEAITGKSVKSGKEVERERFPGKQYERK